MARQYHKWFSTSLNRDMELLVFGKSGAPVIFFPTRTAHFYDYENWRIIAALQKKIDEGLLQIFCVDSVDIESFYADKHPSEKIKRHEEYEDYVIKEVIPFIRKQNKSPYLISAGCSLGGYHAVNIALRHPTHFHKVVGMSARYDLTLSSSSFPNLLSDYFDESIYYNMPSMYVPNIKDEAVLAAIKKLDITLVIGKYDPFYDNNRHLSEQLSLKGIKHDLHVWDAEAHRPYYWRRMVGHYL